MPKVRECIDLLLVENDKLKEIVLRYASEAQNGTVELSKYD